MGPQRPPAQCEDPHPLVERSRVRRFLDLDDRVLERPDPRCEHTVVEPRESQAPPTPGHRYKSYDDRRPSKPGLPGAEAARGDDHGTEDGPDQRQASEVREREADAERSAEGAWEA